MLARVSLQQQGSLGFKSKEKLVVQLVTCMESWVQSPAPHKTRHEAGVAVQTYDPSTKEMKTGGPEVQGHLHLLNEFKANTK